MARCCAGKTDRIDRIPERFRELAFWSVRSTPGLFECSKPFAICAAGLSATIRKRGRAKLPCSSWRSIAARMLGPLKEQRSWVPLLDLSLFCTAGNVSRKTAHEAEP